MNAPQSDPENILIRFWLGKNTVAVQMVYEGVMCSLRWPVEKGIEEKIALLVGHMPRVIKDCANEVFVHTETQELEAEIEQLFGDSE